MGSTGAKGILVGGDVKREPLIGAVGDFENYIREGGKGDVEHGALYDANGEPIIGYVGDADSVNVDDRVLNLQDGSFTHYHPDKDFGGTLSMQDLKVFADSQLKELRAVTSQGYLYKITANKNIDRDGLRKWVNKNQKLAQKNFESAYRSALKAAVTPLKSGPNKGKVKLVNKKTGKATYRKPLTPKQAVAYARKYSVQMFDRMYNKALSKYGLKYTATKSQYAPTSLK